MRVILVKQGSVTMRLAPSITITSLWKSSQVAEKKLLWKLWKSVALTILRVPNRIEEKVGYNGRYWFQTVILSHPALSLSLSSQNWLWIMTFHLWVLIARWGKVGGINYLDFKRNIYWVRGIKIATSFSTSTNLLEIRSFCSYSKNTQSFIFFLLSDA